MKKSKKKLEEQIPLVSVPEELWEEMLERGNQDPKLAQWIYSCWVYNKMI